MQIRDATINDIPRLADIFITAVREDPDYDTAYPWRSSAPDDFAQLMTAEIVQMFLQGQGRFLLVETGQREVVAWACWTRKGSSAAAERIRAENDSVLKCAALCSPRGSCRANTFSDREDSVQRAAGAALPLHPHVFVRARTARRGPVAKTILRGVRSVSRALACR